MSDRAQLQSAPPVYYPVFLDLRGKKCVVIGGGQVAMRKVEGLVEAGASVTVVAPRVAEMPDGVTILRRPFEPADLDGAMLVIAATDDLDVNAQVSREATARGIWVNAVDDTANCSMILPAVVRRGALRIAISTGGGSPVMARKLREKLEADFPPEYGELVSLLWRLRKEWEPRAIAAGVPPAVRKQAWEQVVDLPLPAMLREHDYQGAQKAATEVLEAALARNR